MKTKKWKWFGSFPKSRFYFGSVLISVANSCDQGIFQDLEYGGRGVSQLMGVKLFFSFHRGTLHIFKLQQNGRLGNTPVFPHGR